MKQLFNFIIELGAYNPELSLSDRRNVIRTNFIALISNSLVFIYGFVFYFIDAPKLTVVMAAILLWSIGIFYLNFKQFHTYAKLWLIIEVDICLLYFGLTFGKETGIYLLFFVFNILPFLIFKLSELKFIVPSIILYLVSFVAVEQNLFIVEEYLTNESQLFINTTLRYLIFFWGISNYIFFLISNNKIEKTLEKINKNLTIKNNDLEQFTYIAAHDLKEPAWIISHFTKMVRSKYESKLDEEGDKYLDFISEGAELMDNQLKGLMEHSLIGRNQKLTSIICDDLIRRIIKKNNLNAEISIEQLPVIYGYKKDIEYLFKELLENAVKFSKTNQPSIIEIDCADSNQYWTFSIKDNGIGIATNRFDKIFQTFQQLHNRGVFPGVGIGLAHIKKIVEIHDGKIWVESEEGIGSTFYFSISKELIGL